MNPIMQESDIHHVRDGVQLLLKQNNGRSRLVRDKTTFLDLLIQFFLSPTPPTSQERTDSFRLLSSSYAWNDPSSGEPRSTPTHIMCEVAKFLKGKECNRKTVKDFIVSSYYSLIDMMSRPQSMYYSMTIVPTEEKKQY